MISSHILLQNTNQASYCISKVWWFSRCLYECLALYLQSRKHYFSFWEPLAVLILILNHTHDILSHLTSKHYYELLYDYTIKALRSMKKPG